MTFFMSGMVPYCKEHHKYQLLLAKFFSSYVENQACWISDQWLTYQRFRVCRKVLCSNWTTKTGLLDSMHRFVIRLARVSRSVPCPSSYRTYTSSSHTHPSSNTLARHVTSVHRVHHQRFLLGFLLGFFCSLFFKGLEEKENTVKYLYYGHQGDRNRCPDYRGVRFREVGFIWISVSQGPSDLSIIERCPYYRGVHKERFHCKHFSKITPSTIIIIISYYKQGVLKPMSDCPSQVGIKFALK